MSRTNYAPSDIAIKLTKEELMAELTRRLPLCLERDRAVDAKHKAEERANWRKWKGECRAWGKKQSEVTLEAFKRFGYGGPASPEYRKVQCPEALAPLAKRLLAEVKLSNAQTYTISASNGYWRIHELLTMDFTKPKTVC